MSVAIKVTVNGQTHEHEVEPRQMLVSYLREELCLTGTHVGCDTSNLRWPAPLSSMAKPSRSARCSRRKPTARR